MQNFNTIVLFAAGLQAKFVFELIAKLRSEGQNQVADLWYAACEEAYKRENRSNVFHQACKAYAKKYHLLSK